MGCTLDKNIVVVDDNYTGQVKRNYQIAGQIIDEVIEGYVSILQKLTTEGGISGKTAEKVNAFAETVEALLKEIMTEWSEQITGQMKQYVEEIDRADAEIY